MADAAELVCQLAVVVELAVLDDDDPAVLVRQRLVAMREIMIARRRAARPITPST